MKELTEYINEGIMDIEIDDVENIARLSKIEDILSQWSVDSKGCCGYIKWPEREGYDMFGKKFEEGDYCFRVGEGNFHWGIELCAIMKHPKNGKLVAAYYDANSKVVRVHGRIPTFKFIKIDDIEQFIKAKKNY